ncbi:hypothetical protein QBC39DRAFT_365318 [Podospora conica]|nr:hypothetical protein QBC39DRAFT_365318 [Schizothecium conicum]
MLYIALGWAAVMFLVDIFKANPVTITLIIIGGLLYTGGAIVYTLKKPNRPRPLRLPRDLPRIHGSRVPLPLDGDHASYDEPRLQRRIARAESSRPRIRKRCRPTSVRARIPGSPDQSSSGTRHSSGKP